MDALCKQFLAGSAFSLDQDRCVGFGIAFGQFDQSYHLRIPGQDIPKGVAGDHPLAVKVLPDFSFRRFNLRYFLERGDHAFDLAVNPDRNPVGQNMPRRRLLQLVEFRRTGLQHLVDPRIPDHRRHRQTQNFVPLHVKDLFRHRVHHRQQAAFIGRQHPVVDKVQHRFKPLGILLFFFPDTQKVRRFLHRPQYRLPPRSDQQHVSAEIADTVGKRHRVTDQDVNAFFLDDPSEARPDLLPVDIGIIGRQNELPAGNPQQIADIAATFHHIEIAYDAGCLAGADQRPHHP